MLLNLNIKNYALIENLHLEFASGLNIFTGETGAGKSIIIDCLGLILGDRASSGSIRQNESRCVITAEFDISLLKNLKRYLKESSLEVPENENLILRREADSQGKSRAFVNDTPVSISALQNIGEFLVDVHGQHEHQSLIKTSHQRQLLDRFGSNEELVKAVSTKYHIYKALLAQLESNNLSEQEKERLIDLYSFQVKEIDDAQLKTGEEEEIEAVLPEIKNADKLRELANEAHSAIYSGDGSALEKLGKVKNLIETIATLSPAMKDTFDGISSSYYRLEEAANEIENFAAKLNADPERLNELLMRQDLISKLKKKYGKTVADILSFRDKTAAELDTLNKSGANRKELENTVKKEHTALTKLCADLSSKRKRTADKLAGSVQKELSELGMKKVVFEIKIEPGQELREEGSDKIEFLFSPNAGQDLKPVKEIASGGEMSRVMLALKTVLAKSDSVPVLVFDEIDAGVGGPTAQVVGKKLKQLSKNHQLLCITHLPQIAAFKDNHLSVRKQEHKGLTSTVVATLSGSDSIEEIARMLSGKEITPTAIKHAEELVSQSR
jgi:DNA repair protein RecN (Recombination protein N)